MNIQFLKNLQYLVHKIMNIIKCKRNKIKKKKNKIYSKKKLRKITKIIQNYFLKSLHQKLQMIKKIF